MSQHAAGAPAMRWARLAPRLCTRRTGDRCRRGVFALTRWCHVPDSKWLTIPSPFVRRTPKAVLPVPGLPTRSTFSLRSMNSARVGRGPRESVDTTLESEQHEVAMLHRGRSGGRVRENVPFRLI